MSNKPRAFRISEVCRATGFGRSTIYLAIAAGDLVARKYGRRTIILDEDLSNFLRSLPVLQAQGATDDVQSLADAVHE
jgi:excisionase family DNA binding protein